MYIYICIKKHISTPIKTPIFSYFYAHLRRHIFPQDSAKQISSALVRGKGGLAEECQALNGQLFRFHQGLIGFLKGLFPFKSPIKPPIYIIYDL